MKNIIVMLIGALVGLPAAAVRWAKYHGRETVTAANAFTPSQHKNVITQFTKVTIATRYLLGKSDGTQTGVLVAGLGDRAMFVIKDTTATLDLSLDNPTPVSCIMLGVTDETVPMIAAGPIAVGTIVYPVANGQVNSYVGLGSTGSNYPCGIVVANASVQAGDIVEVMSTVEYQIATV